MNRRLTGCLSDMHFAPLGAQRDNLLLEGTPCESIHVTGNTVIDALLGIASIPHEFTCPDLASIDYANRRVLLVTAHRRENLGEPLRRICRALKTVSYTHLPMFTLGVPILDTVFSIVRRVHRGTPFYEADKEQDVYKRQPH